MGRRSLGSEVQPCCTCHCGVSWYVDDFAKQYTMCQTNGNMLDRTYAYSCIYSGVDEQKDLIMFFQTVYMMYMKFS